MGKWAQLTFSLSNHFSLFFRNNVNKMNFKFLTLSETHINKNFHGL